MVVGGNGWPVSPRKGPSSTSMRPISPRLSNCPALTFPTKNCWSRSFRSSLTNSRLCPVSLSTTAASSPRKGTETSIAPNAKAEPFHLLEGRRLTLGNMWTGLQRNSSPSVSSTSRTRRAGPGLSFTTWMGNNAFRSFQTCHSQPFLTRTTRHSCGPCSHALVESDSVEVTLLDRPPPLPERPPCPVAPHIARYMADVHNRHAARLPCTVSPTAHIEHRRHWTS